jgi:hypothetical protein
MIQMLCASVAIGLILSIVIIVIVEIVEMISKGRR